MNGLAGIRPVVLVGALGSILLVGGILLASSQNPSADAPASRPPSPEPSTTASAPQADGSDMPGASVPAETAAQSSPAETSWQPIALTGTSLAISAPPTWRVTTVLPHRTIVAGPDGSISVIHHETGELDLCPPIGPCASFDVSSIDDLVSYVAREYRLDNTLSYVETDADPVDLGAGEASRMSVLPGRNRIFPEPRSAIVALVGSQSIVIRWSGSLNPPSPLEEILASIRYAN